MEAKVAGKIEVEHHFLEVLMKYALPLAQDVATDKIITLMEGYKFGLTRMGSISEEGAQRLEEILTWLKECAGFEKAPPLDK